MSMDSLKNAVREKATDLGVKMTHDQAKALTDHFFASIVKEVENDGRLIVRDFGTFSQLDKKARVARNPKTGEAVKVPAKTVLKFKSNIEF